MKLLNSSLKAAAAAVVLAGTVIGAQAGIISVTDSTFGSFDSSSGTRNFFVSPDAVVHHVSIAITFAKCDDPSLGAGAQVGDPCIGQDFSFNSEIVFRLSSPDGTTVNLINAGTFSGSTPGTGVVEMTFDDAGAALGALPANGTFDPVGSLSDFTSGTMSGGNWTLFIQDTVGADRLDYFTATLNVTIPEPSSVALAGLALLGLGASARRRVS